MLECSGGNITTYDQDVWEQLGDYAQADPHASLEPFRLLRERNCNSSTVLFGSNGRCMASTQNAAKRAFDS